MKSPILAVAALALATVPAWSADLARAPVAYKAPPVALYNWQGVYIGVNGGYGSGDVNTSQNSVTTSGPLFGLPAGFLPVGARTFTGLDRSYGSDGGFGGFQIGYNAQFGNVVLGIEGDYQFSDIKGEDHFLGSAAGPTYDVYSKMKDFATIRGRLGYAFDSLLIYATGGVAFGNMESTTVDTPGIPGFFLGPQYPGTSSQWTTGYTIGGGLEWGFAQNWSVKAEYQYMKFSDIDVDVVFPTPAPDISTGHARADFDVHTVRVGLNYKLF